MLARLTLLLLVLYALPWHLWPGLLVGAGLFWLLWRSHYRDSFLWFASLPGLYHFWGTSLQTPTLAGAFGDWGLTTVGLLLLGASASAAARQERGAVLWLVPLVALRLDGIALALLVLAHAIYTLERERVRSGEVGRPLGWNRTALLAAVGLLGLLALALVALPVRIALEMGSNPSPSAPVQPGPRVPESGSRPPGQPRPRISPAEPTPFSRFAERASQALLPIILGLMALILSLVGLSALRTPPSKLRPRGFHLVPLVAATFFWVMLLAWLGAHQQTDLTGAAPLPLPGLSPSTPEGEAGPLPPPIRRGVDWVYAVSLGLALLVTALLLVAVALLRRLREGSQGIGVSAARGRGELPAEPPSSRIRRAYQRFLRQMEQRGFPRTTFESPREYATRLGKLNPRALGELRELTELYEPVRYGGSSDETRAERAEALAEALPAVFSQAQEGRA
ncbi:MAG TPA: DUF4129 domain-containing protein [Meiothermus sp.]|nr:DUF4129 domain-containing protein [Meiothermus sp.]